MKDSNRLQGPRIGHDKPERSGITRRSVVCGLALAPVAHMAASPSHAARPDLVVQDGWVLRSDDIGAKATA